MAGTDRTKAAIRDASGPAGAGPVPGGGPAVILVAPQLGENVGTAARAMLNFGFTDLRLVRARDGWPNAFAVKASSGAMEVLDRVRLFESTEAAIADLGRVYATTARPRGMIKPVMTPQAAMAEARGLEQAGTRVGVLFGGERSGLNNDDVTLAQAIITVPVNPAFASLNLAQAVLLVAYEYARQGFVGEPVVPAGHGEAPATADDLIGFYEHLERELDAHNFLYPPEKRPNMVRNIRNMFQRAGLTRQEVRTLRGIVAALVRPPMGPKGTGDGGGRGRGGAA